MVLYLLAMLLFGGQLMSIGILAELITAYHESRIPSVFGFRPHEADRPPRPRSLHRIDHRPHRFLAFPSMNCPPTPPRRSSAAASTCS